MGSTNSSPLVFFIIELFPLISFVMVYIFSGGSENKCMCSFCILNEKLSLYANNKIMLFA